MREGWPTLPFLTRIVSCFLLLTAFCWYPVAASASDATDSSIAIHLLRPGTAAVANLDGDQIPDVASGIRIGKTSGGYSYRVDLDLSADSQAKPFSVFSEDASGLNIEAVDIDGDHDLDLLISGRFSPKPIGIWLNDGRGGFTQGDLAKFALPVLQSKPAVQSPATRTNVVIDLSRRQQIALSREGLDFGTRHLFFGAIPFPAFGLFRISTSSARFRAPPVPSI